MPIYGIDIKIYATAYIRADNEKQAAERVALLTDAILEVRDAGPEVAISGRSLTDPALPDLSLSPAMTIAGPEHDDEPELLED